GRGGDALRDGRLALGLGVVDRGEDHRRLDRRRGVGARSPSAHRRREENRSGCAGGDEGQVSFHGPSNGRAARKCRKKFENAFCPRAISYFPQGAAINRKSPIWKKHLTASRC